MYFASQCLFAKLKTTKYTVHGNESIKGRPGNESIKGRPGNEARSASYRLTLHH